MLLCVQSGSTMADANRFKLEGDGYYLKSPAEMRALFADKYDLREACDNTLADRRALQRLLHRGRTARFMPRYPVPAR